MVDFRIVLFAFSFGCIISILIYEYKLSKQEAKLTHIIAQTTILLHWVKRYINPIVIDQAREKLAEEIAKNDNCNILKEWYIYIFQVKQ